MSYAVCKKCDVRLNGAKDNFGTRVVNGKRYFRHLCKSCWTAYSVKHRTMEASKKRDRRRLATISAHRNAPRLVVNECKKWDRRHKFLPDPALTKEVVGPLLSQGCQYCSATLDEIRIGLDRKNNSLGHLLTNVIPCCQRCNMIRGDMPYAAWLVVSRAVKEARLAGLFGTWVPGNRRNPKEVMAAFDAATWNSTEFSTVREWDDVDYAINKLGLPGSHYD